MTAVKLIDANQCPHKRAAFVSRATYRHISEEVATTTLIILGPSSPRICEHLTYPGRSIRQLPLEKSLHLEAPRTSTCTMPSKTVQIESTTQFSNLLSSSAIVVADFYADWCGPCKQIAPIYEQLSEQLSRPNKITFAKINTDRQQELSQAYSVRAMPTFMIFKNARKIDGIEGADPRRLSAAIKKVAEEANKIDSGADDAASSSGSHWLGASLPRGYDDVTSQVDVLGLELLNWESSKGGARALFGTGKPKGKGVIATEPSRYWVC